jgi:hypothetical protein
LGQEVRFELEGMGPVGDPGSNGMGELPSRNGGDMADNRNQIAPASRLYFQHSEAIVFVMLTRSTDPTSASLGGAASKEGFKGRIFVQDPWTVLPINLLVNRSDPDKRRRHRRKGVRF